MPPPQSSRPSRLARSPPPRPSRDKAPTEATFLVSASAMTKPHSTILRSHVNKAGTFSKFILNIVCTERRLVDLCLRHAKSPLHPGDSSLVCRSWRTQASSVSMISVVIPTLNAAPLLTKTFAALVPAVVDGVVREVIVADSGSGDATQKIADEAGARLLVCDAGRGVQLGAGAEIARHPWLLFLHADTVLEAGWHHKART